MATPLSVARRLLRSVKFGRYDHRSVFAHIYRRRYWGERESVSGPGSSLDQTASIRAALPALIRAHCITSMIDAPCGDLHWMRNILDELGVDYIGGDIVPEVVDLARRNNSCARARFEVFDITESDFPAVDLWMCRDVLFHLSFQAIARAVRNFAASGVPYVLVTSHIGAEVKNRSIVTGDFRQLNLFRAPFRPRQEGVLARFDDYAPPAAPREMLFLRREVFAQLL